MLEESFGLLFYLRKPKNYSKGPLPIYLRITVDRVAKELSLNRSWEKNRWNPYASRPIGTKEDAKELSIFLDSIQVSVYQAKRQIMEAGEQITAGSLMDLVSGKQQRGKMLLKIFKEHNEKMKALVGKDYAAGTYTRFETALKHTRSFIQWKYKVEDINIYCLNSEFVNDLSFWFKTVRNCSHNTTIKYITNLKKVVLLCLNNGWLTKDPFAAFSLSLQDKDPVYLTKEEIQSLIEKEIKNVRLQSVRDIFIFCCFTGLAFIDVKQLKRSEVCIGIDGQLWILKNRQKSAVPSRIPLLPISLQILEKYQDNKVCIANDVLLPVLTNQKYNAYLKELADICNIEKNLTSHTARHTFGTTVTLANRVPIESVKEMMGHKHIKQTLHYARVLPIKLSEDMLLLKERLEKSEFVKKMFGSRKQVVQIFYK
jgi:site-specific recombinase XerD